MTYDDPPCGGAQSDCGSHVVEVPQFEKLLECEASHPDPTGEPNNYHCIKNIRSQGSSNGNEQKKCRNSQHQLEEPGDQQINPAAEVPGQSAQGQPNPHGDPDSHETDGQRN